jgi:hypothetical protein
MAVNIPIEFIQAGIGLIGWLVVKSIYGSIERNKTDSDSADDKVDIKIDKIVETHTETVAKFIGNDRELYQSVGDLKAEIKYTQGYKAGYEAGLTEGRREASIKP